MVSSNEADLNDNANNDEDNNANKKSKTKKKKAKKDSLVEASQSPPMIDDRNNALAHWPPEFHNPPQPDIDALFHYQVFL